MSAVDCREGGSERERTSVRAAEAIAIVGMACRFPGAADIRAFWQLLVDGVDAITEVPAERWNIEAHFDPDASVPGKMSTRWGGFVDGVACFDPEPFRISPTEAEHVDPQQRLVLETAWEALEDAGADFAQLRDARVGVFVGAMTHDYWSLVSDLEQIGEFTATGVDTSIIAARVAYSLGLRGPALTVNTACSSSLVAMHLGLQSLRRGETNAAIVAGVNLILSPSTTVGMTKFGGMAPDGRCKAFDARANGYVRGEGAGVVVLKRLSDAILEGDSIWCVIEGSAVNNDGFSNGLTAPNPHAQVAMLQDAYRDAAVAVDSVQYVEAHGTGTKLGDPIEVGALGSVLCEERREPLLIGSVKTQIGHLEAAAGIAGIIKVALAIANRRLPASLHFEQPNPNIDFDRLGVRVQTRCTCWPRKDARLVAGVSSFGFGGTNCHVVLAEPESVASTWYIPLIGDSERAVAERANAVRAQLESGEATPASAVRSALLRLNKGTIRRVVRGRDRRELVQSLRRLSESALAPRKKCSPERGVVFVFSGNGGQWKGMGSDLLRSSEAFRRALLQCDDALRPLWGRSVIAELERDGEWSVDVVQPLLFAIQVALANYWRELGVVPEASIGHSVGEIAAAYVAGLIDLESAARIVVARSRLQSSEAGSGTMVLVECSPDEMENWLLMHQLRCSVAAINGPRSVVISGRSEVVAGAMARLTAEGRRCHRVATDVAYHSAEMDRLQEPLRAELAGLRASRGTGWFVSSVSGSWKKGGELDAEYWVKNLRQPVRFADGIRTLLDAGYETFLEISPHDILGMDIAACAREAGRRVRVLATLKRSAPTWECTGQAFCELFELGSELSWSAWVAQTSSDRSFADQANSPAPALDDKWLVLPLSAHSADATTERARRVGELLQRSSGAEASAWCSTLATTRANHRARRAVVARGLKDLGAGLLDAGYSDSIKRGAANPANVTRPVFVFSGQGSQWPGMGRRLYEECSGFRKMIQACDREIRHHRDWSLVELIQKGADWEHDDAVQPALFAIQVALAAAWQSFGVTPAAVVGLSMGEVAAAFVAGYLSLEQAIRIICLRSSLLRDLGEGGAMAVVAMSGTELLRLPAILGTGITIAVESSPSACVMSGPAVVLETALEDLRRRNVFCQRVEVRVASHSQAVEPILGLLRAGVGEVGGFRATTPMYSTVTSERLSLEHRLDGQYWAHNLRNPVRFSSAVDEMMKDGLSAFVEISPNPVALRSLEQCLSASTGTSWLSHSVRRDDDEWGSFLGALADYFAQGGEVDWRQLWPSSTKMPGLGYPWRRRRFWVRPGSGTGATHRGHPLLGNPVPVVAGRPGVTAWQRRIPVASRVGIQSTSLTLWEVALLGKEAFAQYQSLRGRRGFLQQGVIEVEQATLDQGLRAGCVWDGQLILTSEGGSTVFEVYAAAVDTAAACWQRVGRLRLRAGGTAQRDDLCEWPARSEKMPSNGPTIREDGWAVTKSWRDKNEGLSAIEFRGPGHWTAADWLSIIGRVVHGEDGATATMAVSCTRLSLRDMNHAPHWIGWRLQGNECDAVLLSSEREVVLSVRGLRLERLSHLTAETAGLIHDVCWEHIELPAEEGPLGRWLIVGDRADACTTSMAAAIEARGGDVVRWCFEQGQGALNALLDSSSFLPKAKLRGAIVLLAPIQGGSGEEIHLGLDQGYRVAELLQSLERYVDRSSQRGGGVWVVTRGVHALPGEKAIPAFEQACVWGYGRVAAIEYPDVWGGVIDLEPGSAFAAQIEQLLACVRNEQGEDQAVIRGGRCLVMRLASATACSGSWRRFDGEKTYVVTGGLGGIGQRCVEWLLRKGAKRIGILGRRARDEGQSLVQRFRCEGARVEYWSVRLERRDELELVLREVEGALGRVAGIFHLAGVFADEPLRELSRSVQESVVGPKLIGAWNLHELTLSQPIQDFVLFSSASALLGARGHGHYAAANSGLDALARYRQSVGLNALSVDWGFWDDGGILSEDNARSLLAAGLLPMSSEVGFDVLESLLSNQTQQPAVVPVDRARFVALFEARRKQPLVSQWRVAGEKTDGRLPAESMCDVLQRSALHQRGELVMSQVKRAVSEVLGFDSRHEIDVERGFFQMGMTSLLALKLTERLRRLVGIGLPATVTFDHPSVAQLSAYIVESLAAPKGHAANDKDVIRMSDDRPPAELSEAAMLGMLQRRLGL